MNKKLSSKLYSYLRVSQVLKDYTEAVDSASMLQTIAQEFSDRLVKVKEFDVPTVGATIPLTDQKTVAFQEVAVRLNIVSNAVLMLANDTQNAELAGNVVGSWTDLVTGSEATRLQLYKSIHVVAKELKEELLPYGVDAALLAELESKLFELDILVGTPRMAINRRSLKNGGQQDTFVKMDTFLKTRLDRAVTTRRLLFPEFYEAYFKARQLQETGGRRSVGSSSGEPTDQALQSALSEISLQATNKEAVMNGAHS